MGFTIAAVAVGLIVGLATGGRVIHLGEHHFRRLPLLGAGVALQLLAGVTGHFGFPVIVASYGFLLAFAWANIRLVGMGVVVIGLALNAFVITINGGMPVRTSSILSAHAASAAEVGRLHLEGKHHLAAGSDHLVLLADAIPVAPLHEVLSFGDLILALGVADVLANLLRPARRRARRQAPAHAHTQAGLSRAGRLFDQDAPPASVVYLGRDDLVVDLTRTGRRKALVP